MSDYQVKVVVTEDNLSSTDIENKIHDFQSILATVASRYYSDKYQTNNHIEIDDVEAN